jgi:hypothetical protein
MIEKYNGLFLHSLNVLLHKYQHYSELHYNILIIIYQVINSLESKHLVKYNLLRLIQLLLQSFDHMIIINFKISILLYTKHFG